MASVVAFHELVPAMHPEVVRLSLEVGTATVDQFVHEFAFPSFPSFPSFPIGPSLVNFIV
jgi:hypothetical protein